MTRVLITGMSGAGKSTLIGRLADLGHRAIDTDYDGWCAPTPDAEPPGLVTQPDWVWREDRMARLLDDHRDGLLFVSGCVPNQGRFYPRFEHVVLLSLPRDVLLERLATRTGNDFGKDPDDLAITLDALANVEPLLRSSASLEIDTRAPVDEVVAALLDHVE
jgi:energy-coupling factor transporter ATP-binding protein EcfA2